MPLKWLTILVTLHACAPAIGQRTKDATEAEKLGAVYQHLRLSPITIDGVMLEPGKKLSASATLISGSRTELEVPESATADQGGHVIGQVAWFVKCTSGPMQNAHSSSRHGVAVGQPLVLRKTRLSPGPNDKFHEDGSGQDAKTIGITLDLNELNLSSGTYRLTLLFHGVTKFALSGSVAFHVHNPGFKTIETKQKTAPADNLSKEAIRSPSSGTDLEFIRPFTCGKIETASEKFKPDRAFSAKCTVIYGQSTPTPLPAAFKARRIGNDPMLAQGFWYLKKKGAPNRVRVGTSLLASKDKDVISPNENFICSTEIQAEKLKLTTGTYELTFEVMFLLDDSRKTTLTETKTILLQR